MSLRITIVTFAWPPRNSIGAHRPYSWARYWAAAGAEVRVLTARKYDYDQPLDLTLPPLPGVEVIETDYAKGRVSLAQRLARGPLKAPALWLYRRLRGKVAAVRNPREGWLAAVRPHLADLATRSDVVVSTYDPRMVHQIAALMKTANPRLFWVADYRDLWSLNHAPDWTDAQRTAEAATERATVAALADLVTSVSDDLARAQGEWSAKPWLAVTNGFDVDLSAIREAIARPLPPPSAPLRIVYTGKIYPGLRDPGPLLEELLAMEAEGVIARGAVVVDVYGGQVEGIEPMLRSGRFDHLLRLHGHVPREAALAAQREADLLLMLESPLPEAKGVLTGKIFEYVATGVPILSLGSRCDSAIGALLASTRTGLCTEDEPALIRNAVLERLHGQHPDWFAPDMAVIEGFSREAQATRLLSAIRDGMAAR